ncbi:MAG: FKBP-type peptidyl-prolyl cis-trans isomerase [Candidatus Pacebacteria bacterium]|nr:FKBP-type peptidyl-prolyl cis-trans isomerase [Candidatus Paceibacterota bacterium]MBP9772309.1 FKBP-type peptidyl-prolyl cis-trans isomerase [Candidatus Paceibacterota bacterium]QQR76846.1 MAG: FKBP-type peptidyl-prolyl cis-trans isomerase [Candidatus Nomurabacteria bacterium]
MNKKTLLNIVIIVVFIILLIIIFRVFPSSVKAPENTDIKTTEISMDKITTASGLSYEIKVVGTGEVATEGSKVSVHYVGTLENGSKFDSSRDRGTPFSFNLGASQVIRGWDEGVAGMKVGETRILTIPSDLAYGPSGIPGVIPGGATLIFEVELLAVE